MSRTASSFSRKGAKFKTQPRLLVICEDEKSSLTYLREAARHYRVFAEIEISNCGRSDPLNIVEEAIQRKKVFDRVYCVIDRDTHENFDEAISLASSKNIEMVISYPCYEYWLLLHFQETRAPVVRKGKFSPGEVMAKCLRKIPEMTDYEKGSAAGLFAMLFNRLGPAKKRAARIITAAQKDGSWNPSTRIHELLETFEGLQNIKLIEKIN